MPDQEAEAKRVLSEFMKEPRPVQLIDSVKGASRDEVLKKLGSLIKVAFRRGLHSKDDPKVQQRWFTICGYLAQVIARVVRDLEYEKLRADLEEVKMQVLDRTVTSHRRSRVSVSTKPDKTASRNRKHRTHTY